MSEALLREYLRQVETFLKSGQAREHGYRPALHSLLQAINPRITPINDPKHVDGVGAPDFIITTNTHEGAFTVGYIETKDIGVSLDKTEQGEQMGRYKRGLENLLLTDYLEFRWYVKGERQAVARLASPQANKSLLIDKSQLATVDDILKSFLGRPVEQIRNPADLARRMARLTHMIRDTTVSVFEQKHASETLRGLFETFKDVLLPDLTVPQFADMFAQTLAYGLFAARYNHTRPTPFTRSDAASEIPRTNPFLRRLFGSIAGPDFEDEPFIGFVNELTQVLSFTDMNAVLADFGKRTRQEDPIVHFYETFLSQYDPKLRELRGVYYTPEPVVSYIVRSVDALLRDEFDCPDGLADNTMVALPDKDEHGRTQHMHRVLLLDPACGTGTFSYSIIDNIRETYRNMGNAGMWSSYVREHLLPRLFGFELLMAPYAVAHLKLGMQLAALDLPPSERANWAYDFNSDERLGIYLTNTLEEALKRANVMLGRFISDEANEAARVKKDYPVMVIVGNPPYSGHSANKGTWITQLLHGNDGSGKKTGNYFEVDGQPLGERNPKWLNDDYVKFLRFAQWRIEQTGYGILAFITNHGYLDNPTFRGMRQSLMQTFDDIYVLDLHGNAKKKERTPDGSKDENVFDIQQGVAIGIFVKKHRKSNMSAMATVHHAHLWGQREVYEKIGQGQQLVGGKYHWLNEHDLTTTEWTEVEPHAPFYLFTPQDDMVKVEYEQGQRVTDILMVHSIGIATARDALTIQLTKDEMWKVVDDFISLSSEDARNKYELGKDARDWQVSMAQQDVKKSGPTQQNLVPILYRPFDNRCTYYTGNTRGFHCMPRSDVMYHMLVGKNRGLVTTRSIEIGRGWEHIFCANELIQLHTVSIKEVNYLFPLYLYPDSKQKSLLDIDEPTNAPGGRRPNLSPQFIQEMESRLGMRFVSDGRGDGRETFGPEDVFNYMYAVFHSPTYRARYAEFLKIDFPRLPLTSDASLFWSLCGLGDRLVKLHLMERYGTLTPAYPVPGNNLVERVEYLEPKDAQRDRVYINKTQYFEGVPPDVWSFSVGGYQVCHKWLKDRKGRVLSFQDIQHYQRIVGALAETITLMERIDEAIEEHGGWPLS